MVKITSNQSGYIALLAVLVTGSVATSVALFLLTSGTDSQRSALIEQQSKQARSLAVACAEEGLLRLHDSTAYLGSGSLTLGQGACTYTVSVADPTTRNIVAVGTVGNVVKQIQAYATIGSSNINATSWQEDS